MIRDEEFLRGKVPMTKQEVRAVALSMAGIGEGSIVCDVGAGTGSITVESAIIAKKGQVFAFERNAEATSLLRRNLEKFALTNITVVKGEAPQGMENLPPLDAAFVGGSGGHLPEILDALEKLLNPSGRLVVLSVTAETFSTALNWLEERGHHVEAAEIAVTRYEKIGSYHMKKAQNPVTILVSSKK